jgi:hypothetical protein
VAESVKKGHNVVVQEVTVARTHDQQTHHLSPLLN